MLLGTKPHTAGNRRAYAVDYSDWLEEGMSLASGTVVLSAAFTATVTDVVISAVAATPSNHLVFTMQGGSINEAFTLDVQGIDSRGEIKNDTVGFVVIKP